MNYKVNLFSSFILLKKKLLWSDFYKLTRFKTILANGNEIGFIMIF